METLITIVIALIIIGVVWQFAKFIAKLLLIALTLWLIGTFLTDVMGEELPFFSNLETAPVNVVMETTKL